MTTSGKNSRADAKEKKLCRQFQRGENKTAFVESCGYKKKSGIKSLFHCNKADGLGSGSAKNSLCANTATSYVYQHERGAEQTSPSKTTRNVFSKMSR